VRVEGVLDRQLVQAELSLELAQVLLAGCFDADPDEMAGARRPLAALLDPDIRDLAASAVGRRSHHPAHGSSLAWRSADAGALSCRFRVVRS
jgi:hypothetical protein